MIRISQHFVLSNTRPLPRTRERCLVPTVDLDNVLHACVIASSEHSLVSRNKRLARNRQWRVVSPEELRRSFHRERERERERKRRRFESISWKVKKKKKKICQEVVEVL